MREFKENLFPAAFRIAISARREFRDARASPYYFNFSTDLNPKNAEVKKSLGDDIYF